MIVEDLTTQDCHREAWLESQIKVAQRKIDRLCKEISFKEEIAQRLMSLTDPLKFFRRDIGYSRARSFEVLAC